MGTGDQGMRGWGAAVALAAAAVLHAAPAAAQPTGTPPPPDVPSPPVISGPPLRVLVGPSEQDLARFYPEAAAQARVDGTVMVSCTVTDSGRLDACNILAETPQGMGFGAAALKMMTHYRFDRTMTDGRPSAGQTFWTTLRWRLPK